MSHRERLPLAGSGLEKEIFEVPPGAGWMNGRAGACLLSVVQFGQHTLRALSENQSIFIRVEPRIISSLRRWNSLFFF